MNDSEKLNLTLIQGNIQKLQELLGDGSGTIQNILKDIRTELAAILMDVPASSPAPVSAPQRPIQSQPGPQSIHDRLPNLPDITEKELRSHTMEYNEKVTKG